MFGAFPYFALALLLLLLLSDAVSFLVVVLDQQLFTLDSDKETR